MVLGWGSERFPRYLAFNEVNRSGFQDIKPLMKRTGCGMPGTPGGTSQSVLLNGSCQKNFEYIWFNWFRGGDPNGF